MGHVKNYSESTAVEIDNEIRRIVQENYERARKLLTEHRQQLTALSEALLERETLDGAEIRRLVFGEEPAGEVAGETVAPAAGPCVDGALSEGAMSRSE